MAKLSPPTREMLDIDCTRNNLIVAYVEHYTDPEGTLQLVRAVGSVEVTMREANAGQEAET